MLKSRSLIAVMAVISIGVPYAGTAVMPQERLEVNTRSLQWEKSLRPWQESEIVVKTKGASFFTREAVPAGRSVESFMALRRRDPNVEYAEPNYIAYAHFTPNDAYFSPYQWHLDNPAYGGIHMQLAWDMSQGEGVVVAVIDTGVAYEDYGLFKRAPDLASTVFVPGYDFVNNDTHPNDDQGHGTHVTGTIAQSTNNNMGAAGVAYKVSIMPIKVLNSQGSGSYADVAEGIRWAADHGAKVINLSLGGAQAATYLEEALAYAYNKGATIVAASGNDGANIVSYPAAYDQYVIAVGATRYDEARARYSNYGSSLDIVAPGGDTSVDQNRDGYGDGILQQTFSGIPSNFGYYFFQGTSMAAPHAAGVAALIISKGVTTTPDGVREILQTTADDLGVAGRDNIFGWGLINARAALGGVAAPPPIKATTSPALIEVFYDSFEVSEWNSMWTEDSQNDWFRSSQRATNGTRSAEVDGFANGALLMSKTIDMQGKTKARVSFDWLIESTLDTGEYAAFDVSVNGGDWIEKARIKGNVDPENVWQPVAIDLADAANLRLRFRGTMSASNEDANVDNVRVIGE